ncbi:hypothetical protein RB623_08980 [Mesorhizobium sp. LHD-90]|uniref:hypothetical protein n=1 Tax=Mesorhizobium sp. LHD-90 TaxID=3071414 RepID=UPI0027E0FDD9|nr:hypothetical protein [Mesorhizobium sp. LHD-90]MDQ6434181.1 hypothetical protein [Mesorhizobium sp. LHD-90]
MDDDIENDDADTWRIHWTWDVLPPSTREAMADALRLAATAGGAPARCRRKDCKQAHRCSFKLDKHGDGICLGGITDEMVREAALMLKYSADLWRKYGPTWREILDAEKKLRDAKF